MLVRSAPPVIHASYGLYNTARFEYVKTAMVKMVAVEALPCSSSSFVSLELVYLYTSSGGYENKI